MKFRRITIGLANEQEVKIGRTKNLHEDDIDDYVSMLALELQKRMDQTLMYIKVGLDDHQYGITDGASGTVTVTGPLIDEATSLMRTTLKITLKQSQQEEEANGK